jgi:hypothetical protein
MENKSNWSRCLKYTLRNSDGGSLEIEIASDQIYVIAKEREDDDMPVHLPFTMDVLDSYSFFRSIEEDLSEMKKGREQE